jgi:hypothetical protein
LLQSVKQGRQRDKKNFFWCLVRREAALRPTYFQWRTGRFAGIASSCNEGEADFIQIIFRKLNSFIIDICHKSLHHVRNGAKYFKTYQSDTAEVGIRSLIPDLTLSGIKNPGAIHSGSARLLKIPKEDFDKISEKFL